MVLATLLLQTRRFRRHVVALSTALHRRPPGKMTPFVSDSTIVLAAVVTIVVQRYAGHLIYKLLTGVKRCKKRVQILNINVYTLNSRFSNIIEVLVIILVAVLLFHWLLHLFEYKNNGPPHLSHWPKSVQEHQGLGMRCVASGNLPGLGQTFARSQGACLARPRRPQLWEQTWSIASHEDCLQCKRHF